MCPHCGGQVMFSGKGHASNAQSQGLLTVDKLIGTSVVGGIPPPFTPVCATVAMAIDLNGRNLQIGGQPVATNAAILMTNGGFPLILSNPGSAAGKVCFQPSAVNLAALKLFKPSHEEASGAILSSHWGQTTAHLNDTVQMVANLYGVDEGGSVEFEIYRYKDDGKHESVTTLSASIKNSQSGSLQAVADWIFDREADVGEARQENIENGVIGYRPLWYFFNANYENKTRQSMPLDIRDWIEFEITDIEGKDSNHLKLILYQSDGSFSQFQVDEGTIENIAIGYCNVDVINSSICLDYESDTWIIKDKNNNYSNKSISKDDFVEIVFQFDIDPSSKENFDDTFTLSTSDDSYKVVKTIKDDCNVNDNKLQLNYENINKNSPLSMLINPGESKESYYLFENKTYEELIL